MGEYRLYLFNESGHIGRSKEMACDDDQQAIERATELRHAHLVEVWQGARLVKRIEPAGPLA